MNKTKIEYLTHTWNPIAMRCTPVGAGCANCWHLRMANRLAGNRAFPPEVQDAYAGEGPPVPLIESRLCDPLRRKKPAVIGVQLMGDLFHKDVPFEAIRGIWEVMMRSRWHTFLILTKRLAIMQRFLTEYLRAYVPPKHIWLGVSVEDQESADERIPISLQIPAAVHYVSLEPMLGAVNLYPRRWLNPYPERFADGFDVHTGKRRYRDVERPRLNWVICGGETGPSARPMKPDWARSIRDQCQAAGIPFFFKSHGAWLHESQFLEPVTIHTPGIVTFEEWNLPKHQWPDGSQSYRVGKRAAGRMLDGKVWNEMPEVRK